MTPEELLLSQLSKLPSSQFEQVLYLARIPKEHIPAATAAPALRAIELLRYAEQQNQLHQLARIVQQVTGDGRAKHPFFKWFNRRRKAALGIVSLVIVIAQIGTTALSVRDRLFGDVAGFLAQHLRLVPAALHVIAIFVMILLVGQLSTYTTVGVNEDEDYVRARTSLRTIYHYWSVLLVSWLIFYIFLTINYAIFSTAATGDCLANCVVAAKALSDPSGRLFDSAATYLLSAENLLNNIPTVMFFMLFWEMSETTLEPDHKGGARRKARSNPWFALIASLLVFSAAEVFYRGMNFDPSWHLAFTQVPAIAAAVAMALFIGRVESKYINPPRIIVLLLYTYAGIQPLFAMFDVHPVLGLTMYNVALFLKICLFMLMYWLISEGRLLYYISKTNEIEQTVDAEFQAFCKKHGIQQSS